MELARALTHRKRQGTLDKSSYMGPARAASMRQGPIKRSAISNPVQLISTTNHQVYNAPNIYGSADESDSSMSLAASSRATTPEMCSEDSPVEPNHLSTYFQTGPSAATRTSKDSTDIPSPRLPTRAFSHTKQSHQLAARQRAESRTMPPPNAIHNSLPAREMFSTPPASDHPFGAELSQLNEVAEKFDAREVIIDEEEQYLQNNGLCKFGADEYVDEIQGLFGGSVNNPFSSFAPAWI